MNYHDAYAAYDGTLPDTLRQVIFHGSMTHYADAYRRTRHDRLAARCLDIVRSLAAWRMTRRYPVDIRHSMLGFLSHALSQARHQAISALQLLQ